MPQYYYCGKNEAISGGSLGTLATVELTRRQTRTLERIRSELAALGPCLPGSVVVRTGRCGKPGCSCHDDPPRLHGPFRSWTRKVEGKTVTKLLTDEQLDDYQTLFANQRRLRQLMHQLEQLGLDIVERDRR